VILLLQTTNELEKNPKELELTKVAALLDNQKIISDSINAFTSQNNTELFSYNPDKLVSPMQIIQTRRILEFERAKSVALNIHHTLIVK
jgi:hypothetical protein